MNDYRNDSRVNSILKLKSSDDFCFCYEPLPEYGKGKQTLYKIMDGLYFYFTDMCNKKKNVEMVPEKIENTFDHDIIGIYHYITGSILLQLNNYTGKFSTGESFYFVGNPKFVKSKALLKENYSMGFIAYADMLQAILDKFKDCNDIDVNKFYNSLNNIQKPFIMKTKLAVASLIKEILGYIESNNYFMIKNKAFELLYLSFKQYNNVDCKAAYQIALIEKVNRIKKHIDSHYKEKIIISELLKKYIINKTYFYEVFNYLYGISPYKYVTKLRLSEATNLLAKTDLSVENIAYTCGYDNTNKFIKLFKKEYGTTPSKIR